MYSGYKKDKTCLSSKTPTCLIFKNLTFILYDLINHPNIMGAGCSCGKFVGKEVWQYISRTEKDFRDLGCWNSWVIQGRPSHATAYSRPPGFFFKLTSYHPSLGGSRKMTGSYCL
jgi:hypothetical protein